MSFTWPVALVALLFVPGLFGVYRLSLRRKRKNAVRYSSVAVLRAVVPNRTRWRRHAPLVLLLSCIGVLAFSAARPRVSRSIPIARTSIILALDVSRSMCSNDVAPNRLAVAQAAARSFIADQPDGARIGLVVFSGFAQVAVAPTADRKALLQAIDGLSTATGTAIGAALLKSLDAIAEINADVQPVGNASGGEAPPSSVAAASGDFVPDIVVLLTDGANTRGIAPLDAVPYAIERKVRVYTIGFGTTNPGQLVCTAAQLGGSQLGGGGGFGGPGGGGFGGGGGGGGRFLIADEPTLQAVAERTGGEYYRAEDAAQLKKVFAELPNDVERQHERHEITTWFVAFAVALAGAAVAASLKWGPTP